MKKYDYLIAGAGMAAAAAVMGIRQMDRDGSIGIIGGEGDPPYARPPLSKALWKGKTLESIWMDSADAELHLGMKVQDLQASRHSVRCSDGRELEYGQLLLATGSRPRILGFPEDPVIYLHDLKDYRALRGACVEGSRFLVLGGGFVGSEIAAALRINGALVSLLFPGAGLCSSIFPPGLSSYLDDYYRGKGVELFPGESLVAIERGEDRAGRRWVARCSGGREFPVDAIVAGLGTLPNSALAEAAGLAVGDGIEVGPSLRTSESDILAAGDVASFRCEALGGRIRVEHEDNALMMGLGAGRIMAGADETYDRIPSFYSDLFELGYEAAGQLDSAFETVIDWKKPFEQGLIYYLKGGRVRGVLLWNTWRRVEAARALIAEGRSYSPRELLGWI
jgi:3-phenylpropionate/trans-cinnamate dioxygenase ferredoxin reductase component